MFDLISIGDSTIDVFHELEDHEIDVLSSLDTGRRELCMTFADKIPVKRIERFVAGNAANNAVGASRLGLRNAIYTIVGDDDSGMLIRSKLTSEGVATDYVLTERDSQTNYSTVLSFRGERTILIYHVPRHYRFPKMQPTTWVYLTSMSKGYDRISNDLIKYLKENRAKLIFQPGTFQLRAGLVTNHELLEQTQILILNKQEAEEWLKLPPQSDPKHLLAGLLKLGPKIVVITDGQLGSYATNRDEVWFLGARSEVPRVEATGAGDAYATGFSIAIIHDQTIDEAMRWGTFNAEGVIQQIGPQAGLLTREAMEYHLSKYPNLKAKPIR